MRNKVILLTKTQLNKLEFILNKFLGRYLSVKNESLDIDGNIATVEIDEGKLMQDINGKYAINADKVIRLFQQLTPAQRQKIKERFENVDLKQFIIDRMMPFEDVVWLNDPNDI